MEKEAEKLLKGLKGAPALIKALKELGGDISAGLMPALIEVLRELRAAPDAPADGSPAEEAQDPLEGALSMARGTSVLTPRYCSHRSGTAACSSSQEENFFKTRGVQLHVRMALKTPPPLLPCSLLCFAHRGKMDIGFCSDHVVFKGPKDCFQIPYGSIGSISVGAAAVGSCMIGQTLRALLTLHSCPSLPVRLRLPSRAAAP